MGWETFIGAYSSIFGLEARYEQNGLGNLTFGIFNLRFLGFQEQSTHLTLQLGLRSTQIGSTAYRNALAGLNMSLYVSKYFGIEGLYRKYFPSVPEISGTQFTGERFQMGAFIDFKFLRIYGDYVVNNESNWNLNGIQLGTKIYF
jgi:hypothetical protein